MDKTYQPNYYLELCQQALLRTIHTFDHSDFVPDTSDVSDLVKECLNTLFANTPAMTFKMMRSGSIVKTNVRPTMKPCEKKQSFCSEFDQMVRNLVGILGFEFSRYIAVHVTIIAFVKKIAHDIESATTYDEMLELTKYIHRLLRPYDSCTYVYTIQTPGRDQCDVFFERIIRTVKERRDDQNMSMFDRHRDELVREINSFLDSIVKGQRSIETVDQLIISMNMGRYAILYNGSFIKIFEIEYKACHANNPGFNDRSLIKINSYDMMERYINNYIGLRDKTTAYYLSYLENYYFEIYRKQVDAALANEKIHDDVVKMSISPPLELCKSMARITLCMLLKLIKNINTNRDVLILTSAPSRMQLYQLLQSFLLIPSGFDVDWSLEQICIIYYALATDKVVKTTRERESKVNTKSE